MRRRRQDAYQRALEIFLRHRNRVVPDTAVAWLRAVVRHEALAVRGERLPGADEHALAFERLQRSAEALQGLKPHELRALVLKAHGYSYQEISEITGRSYTNI